MHITCPHCSAAYEVGPVIKNALLVCYRCNTEFSVDETLVEEKNDPLMTTEEEASLPLFEHMEPKSPEGSEVDEPSEEQQQEEPVSEEKFRAPEPERFAEKGGVNKTAVDIEPVEVKEPAESSTGDSEGTEKEIVTAVEDDKTPLPPVRKSAVIWPWLIFILLLIGGSGVWYKQDAWLDHPWVRSVLINMHLPVEVRDKDWRIVPESVHGQWLTRDDQSRILMIEGRVANQLYCELSPPRIQVHFFDDSGLDQVLGKVTLAITEPPGIEQVKHAPFEMPDIDRVPVEAQGERGFFLVLDSLPERTADFTLTAVANSH
jgi:hypothetical protein